MDTGKPRWWMLYATVPFMVLAVFFIMAQNWVSWEKTVVSLIVIIGTFAMMAIWMEANQGNIVRADIDHERRAQAKRRRELKAWRSRPIRAVVMTHSVPTTGFGSARFRPSYTYEFETASDGLVRVVRHVDATQCKGY